MVLVLFLSYGVYRPLLQSGYFNMHDDTQPARIQQMSKELSSGQFPVRWVGDLGYGFGYPLYNFYAPLPYYTASFFYLSGIDLITSTKIMFIIGILLAAFSMYFLGNALWGEVAGVTTSILYTYAPYHAVNVYVRGAVGELYAYGFLPIFLLGILNIFSFSGNDNKKNGKFTELGKVAELKFRQAILLSSLALSGIVLSHNILAIVSVFFISLFLLFYFGYLLIREKSMVVLKIIFISLILGLGLTSFFSIPALAEKNYTQVAKLTAMGSDFHLHFVYLGQLWDSAWGYAGSAPGLADGMSFKIGKLNLLVGAGALLIVLRYWRNKDIGRKKMWLFILMLLLFILSVFFMLVQSAVFYETIPLFAYIQYPWRFLNFGLLSLTVLGSFIFIVRQKIFRYSAAVLIVGLTIIFNTKYFMPQKSFSVDALSYISPLNLRYKISKISDEYLPTNFKTAKGAENVAYQALLSSDQMTVNTLSERSTHKLYSVNAAESHMVTTNISSFPGWRITIDGKKVAIDGRSGRIAFYIPSGKHLLDIKFVNTPIRFAANTVSIFSLILLLYVSLKGIRGFYAKKFLS